MRLKVLWGIGTSEIFPLGSLGIFDGRVGGTSWKLGRRRWNWKWRGEVDWTGAKVGEFSGGFLGIFDILDVGGAVRGRLKLGQSKKVEECEERKRNREKSEKQRSW